MVFILLFVAIVVAPFNSTKKNITANKKNGEKEQKFYVENMIVKSIIWNIFLRLSNNNIKNQTIFKGIYLHFSAVYCK